MSAPIPSNEPESLRAGDTWQWTRTLADYPATLWTLTYYFKHPTATGFSQAASASGTDFSLTISAANTANKTAGRWTWMAQVVDIATGLEKHTVDSGTLEILPNYAANNNALDDRSHARKTLDALQAVIENRATMDQNRFMIAGRELWRMTPGELIQFKNHYAALVRGEEQAERIRNGGAGGGRIQFIT